MRYVAKITKSERNKALIEGAPWRLPKEIVICESSDPFEEGFSVTVEGPHTNKGEQIISFNSEGDYGDEAYLIYATAGKKNGVWYPHIFRLKSEMGLREAWEPWGSNVDCEFAIRVIKLGKQSDVPLEVASGIVSREEFISEEGKGSEQSGCEEVNEQVSMNILGERPARDAFFVKFKVEDTLVRVPMHITMTWREKPKQIGDWVNVPVMIVEERDGRKLDRVIGFFSALDEVIVFGNGGLWNKELWVKGELFETEGSIGLRGAYVYDKGKDNEWGVWFKLVRDKDVERMF